MGNDKKSQNKDGTTKSTAGIDVSNIPIATLNKIDAKVDQLGITRSSYIKNLINADLKENTK